MLCIQYRKKVMTLSSSVLPNARPIAQVADASARLSLVGFRSLLAFLVDWIELSIYLLACLFMKEVGSHDDGKGIVVLDKASRIL